MRREDLKVEVAKLRHICKADELGFRDTSEVMPVEGFIGQERAVEALKLGLEIENPEYNIFITGKTGTGRKAVLRSFLEKFAEGRMASGEIVLKDFCYIHNFDYPDQPKILIFEKGKGKKFKKQMDGVLRTLQRRIPAAFQTEEYTKAEEKIQKEFERKLQEVHDKLQKKAKEAGLFVRILSDNQYRVGVLSETGDSIMPEEEYENLTPQEKETIEKNQTKLINYINKKLPGKIQDLRKEVSQKIEELEKKVVNDILESIFGALSRDYPDYPEVLAYFEGLKEFIFDNIDLFKPQRNGQQIQLLMMGQSLNNGRDKFSFFRVNLFVDNSQTEKPPIIFENHPTFANLFGRIEKQFSMGAYLTDHTYLKPGSLCRADGGYLVLNILDILRNPGVWEKLKKTLRTGFLKIEEPLSYLGLASTNLHPDPMPVKLKVIVIGEPIFYHLLVEHDPDFLSVFKVKAEFDSEMPLSSENLAGYAGFVSLCCQKEGLLPFDATAVAKVAEQGMRLADKQKKLATDFGDIKTLVVESSYWAKKAQSDKVKAEHVKKALEARRLRLNLAEEKMQEFIKDEMLLIDTEGEKVGQINSLVVYSVGDYVFSRPSRITAKTFLGKRGLVSIQREVKLSGPIHDTGVLILQGFFGDKYGQEIPVSFSASLCFEQSYGGVEGDSASAAELFCLISSLSRLPIDQSLAVTGSVNQRGEIQSVGGVNQKIEGFFDVCKERGLTGKQGVVIPCQNVQCLMLREDVVEAVRDGRFHIYAIKTVDEGMEILMNKTASEIHEKVADRLKEMSEKIREYEIRRKGKLLR